MRQKDFTKCLFIIDRLDGQDQPNAAQGELIVCHASP